jgi:L-fuconolactonase
MIVDTHVHVVSDDQQKYPRKVTRGALYDWVQDMTAETLLSLNAQAGIDKTVLVQAYSAYKYDNSYTVDCAASTPTASPACASWTLPKATRQTS